MGGGGGGRLGRPIFEGHLPESYERSTLRWVVMQNEYAPTWALRDDGKAARMILEVERLPCPALPCPALPCPAPRRATELQTFLDSPNRADDGFLRSSCSLGVQRLCSSCSSSNSKPFLEIAYKIHQFLKFYHGEFWNAKFRNILA